MPPHLSILQSSTEEEPSRGGLIYVSFLSPRTVLPRFNVKQMQEEEEEALGRSPTQQGHTEDQTVQLSVERPNLRGSITA